MIHSVLPQFLFPPRFSLSPPGNAAAKNNVLPFPCVKPIFADDMGLPRVTENHWPY
jgi:hypothetical protein